MPDNYELFKQHEDNQLSKLDRLPTCTNCGEYIQDDYYYEINEEYLCEECMISNYRKDVEEYVDCNY